jgi:hypothetical protein
MPLDESLKINNFFLPPHGNLCIPALTLIPKDDLIKTVTLFKITKNVSK